jgi:hypothetical protein
MADQEGGQFVWLSQQWLSGLCVVTLNPKRQTVDWEIGQLSRPVVIPPFLVLTVCSDGHIFNLIGLHILTQ